MHHALKIVLLSSIITLISCNQHSKKNADEKSKQTEVAIAPQLSKAEALVAETIKAHGGERYNNAHYAFSFRDKNYRFKNDTNNYQYSVHYIKNSDSINDRIVNGKFERSSNGKTVSLSDKDIAKYSEALNSVLYFATLPHKLKDKAVRKTYEGLAKIKSQDYELLGVSFTQEGGGKDYDDKFLYWINAKTKTVDYLAYSYSTNGGGVRFRSAFNQRNVNGIRFQDYINYKVPLGTALKDITALYTSENLEELSRILTENVRQLQ